MKNIENKLSRYIDLLNEGKKPVEHSNPMEDQEYGRLLKAVRRVRILREQEYPEADYPVRLIAALNGGLSVKKRSKSINIKRIVFTTTAVAAAAAILYFAPKAILPGANTGVVYAMEKAFQKVKAYKGRIEVVEMNGLGEKVTQAAREVWADDKGNYYINELEGTAKGIITVNNGDSKWQLRPEEKSAYLFAAFPDPYRFTFELAQEVDDVKTARTVKEVGMDTIAGRSAIILEVTPDGGQPYRLWIDEETDLPLQRETAMQNAIQYRVTYSSIEFLEEIPSDLLQYKLPAGYAEVNTDAEQIVNTLEEAEGILGFAPKVIDPVPDDYTMDKIAITKDQTAAVLYYTGADEKDTVVIRQSKAAADLKPASSAVLGTVGSSTAEVLADPAANSIRWQENGMEYQVLGNVGFDSLMFFAGKLTLNEIKLPSALLSGETEPGKDASTAVSDENNKEPEVAVSVDMEVEENEQKSVDAGHSPWKLDPVFVTQVFASLLISPDGIVGDYPIAYDNIKIIENDGTRAVAQITDAASIAGYVYLERLVRQDETGIWTVVGYDKVQ